jgi:hypothetical protein
MCFFRFLKSTPSWKAVSKVVTSLLTFTRSKKGKYEWIQLVGHPGNISFFSFYFNPLGFLYLKEHSKKEFMMVMS